MEQIYIKDYVCNAEIGVFESEHGNKQRLRFNIVLTLDYQNVCKSDNLEDVVSYEIIVDAIHEHLSGKRINLLETLAEKISKTCLNHKHVIKIRVQIEKLDRIDGSLGIILIRDKD